MENGKIRVCYLITKGVWGGAQKYVYNLAISLPADKYEVTVVCGEGKTLKQKLEEKGVKVIEIENLKRDISFTRELISFLKLYKIIKEVRPDILHLNSPKAGGLGSIIGKILSIKKIIYTVHGFSWNEDRSSIEKSLITLFTWVTIFLCHITITISTKEEDEAKKLFFVNKNKIALIRNGVEKIAFLDKSRAREFLEEKIGRKFEDNFVIGTISELTKNKGLDYAIAGLSKIRKPFIFLILGGGILKDELQKTIDRYELNSKIFLIGFVQDANKYLKAFDLFTLTSIKEGLPYTILEAGQAGVPVLASRISGIPDIIDDGKNGALVTKAKPGEISRAIEYLMENPKIRNSFAKKLSEKIESEFTLEKMVEKTVALYN